MCHSPLEIMCIVLDILYAYRRSYNIDSSLSEGGEFLRPIKIICWGGGGRILVLNPRNGTVQLCKNQRELIELSRNTVTINIFYSGA